MDDGVAAPLNADMAGRITLGFVLGLTLAIGTFLALGGPLAGHTVIPLDLPFPDSEYDEEDETPPWRDVPVQPGDNLSLIFKRAGLGDREVEDVVRRAEGGKKLRRLHPGEVMRFQVDATGALLALRHEHSKEKAVLYQKTEDGYRVEAIQREPFRYTERASRVIESSLYEACKRAGLKDSLIMEMARVFGGVIDFALDTRKGDTFHLIYEDLYLDGESYRPGEILATEYVNRGERHTAYRFTDKEGNTGYFNEKGVPMHKQFLRAPLDFTRVSSNFNPRRLHPIYKTHRAHRGTDYAAPRGTKVYAAGDGRVVEAGYTKANGQYLVLKHGDTYTTKYLHLHRRLVKKGRVVKQGQTIGTVGSTGAATGPHLHYEFLINGVHQNPRTVHRKLPVARSLKDGELETFAAHIRPLEMQLASLRQQKLVAHNSPPQ